MSTTRATADQPQHPSMTVHAVIVTHQPDPDRLLAALEAIESQVQAVYLVHNGAHPPSLPLRASSALHLLVQGGNTGLAAALNTGIRHARLHGAQAVLLLDQDSVAAPNLVQHLLHAAAQAQTQGQANIAAVASRIDLGDGRGGGIHLSWLYGYRMRPAPADRDWQPCDLVLTSGTLIPLAAIERIGEFFEPLFVDRVDTEWSLRARHAGWRLIMAPRAHLDHRLGMGREALRLGSWVWAHTNTHSPPRYQGMLRSSLWLLRSPVAPLKWRCAEIRQWLRMGLALLLWSPQRNQRWPWVRAGWQQGQRSPPSDWPRAQPPAARMP